VKRLAKGQGLGTRLTANNPRHVGAGFEKAEAHGNKKR